MSLRTVRIALALVCLSVSGSVIMLASCSNTERTINFSELPLLQDHYVPFRPPDLITPTIRWTLPEIHGYSEREEKERFERLRYFFQEMNALEELREAR